MAKHRARKPRTGTGTHAPSVELPRVHAHPARDTRDIHEAHRSSHVLVALVAAFAIVAAIVERLSFSRAWGESGSLTSAFYYGDATRFVQYAIAILQGKPFDNGIPFHPPGWPLVLAAFMWLAGVPQAGDVTVPIAAIKLLLASVSGLTVGLAALLAYELAGPGAMLAVALLGPFHFGHIVQGSVATSEALYGLLVAGALLFAARWLRPHARGRAGWAAACGVVSGCATLVRPEFLAAVAVLAGVAIQRTAGVGRSAIGWKELLTRRAPGARHDLRGEVARELAVFAACVAIAMAPTTVWHWRTLSEFNAKHVGRVAGPLPRFAPVTSYGPFNFAVANHERAEGGPNSDHPLFDQCDPEHQDALEAGQFDLACPAIYDLYVHGYRIGVSWMIANPGDAITLMRRKVGMATGFLAQGYLIDDVGAGVNGERRRVDMFDPERRWLLPVHLVLLLAGFIVLRRPPIARGLLAAPLIALVASTLLFYGYVRHGIGYAPVIWVLEAGALSYLADRLAPGVRRRTAVALVLALATLLVVFDGVRARSVREVALDGLRDPSGALVQDETVQVRQAP